MKLPPQIAAVVREGHSWPARRSSAHGVSPSFRHDFNVCVHDSRNAKCGGTRGVYPVSPESPGTCQCLDCPNGYKKDPDSNNWACR